MLENIPLGIVNRENRNRYRKKVNVLKYIFRAEIFGIQSDLIFDLSEKLNKLAHHRGCYHNHILTRNYILPDCKE